MKASAKVAAISVALILGSLILLAAEAFELTGAVEICQRTGKPLTSLLTTRIEALCFIPVIFCLLGLATAAGLLFVREWARKAALFLALAPLIVYLPIILYHPASIFPRAAHGTILTIRDFGFVLCVYSVVILSPFSAWWLAVLTRPQVRSEFES